MEDLVEDRYIYHLSLVYHGSFIDTTTLDLKVKSDGVVNILWKEVPCQVKSRSFIRHPTSSVTYNCSITYNKEKISWFVRRLPLKFVMSRYHGVINGMKNITG